MAWAQVHRKQVIAGAVAVMVVIVIGYVVHWKNKQTRLAASEALLSVAMQVSGGGDDAAAAGPKPAELLRVAEQFSSTSAAERALLLAAAAAYRGADYSQAAQLFQRFGQEHPSSVLEPIAVLGEAASLDAQEKIPEAIAAYERVVARHSRDPVANRARLALATVFEEQDKPADALRIYDVMADEAGFNEQGFEASARRERLLRLHPELAPPAPAVTNAVNVASPPQEVGTTTLVEAATAPAPTETVPEDAPAATPPAE